MVSAVIAGEICEHITLENGNEYIEFVAWKMPNVKIGEMVALLDWRTLDIINGVFVSKDGEHFGTISKRGGYEWTNQGA